MTMTQQPVKWTLKRGTELSAAELYDCLQLRAEVFVVEQDVVYQDLDGLDLRSSTYHLFAHYDSDPAAAAYLRFFDEEGMPEKLHIGRVIVREKYRSTGLGRALMSKALDAIEELRTAQSVSSIEVHGQTHLRKWYESFGFSVEGDEFILDTIPHFVLVKAL